MFRDLLSSRLIQAGLIFFVLIVVSGSLYLEYVKHTSEKELLKTKKSLLQVEPVSTIQHNQQPENPGIDIVEETDAPTTDDPHAHNIVAEEIDVRSTDHTALTALTDVWDIPIEAEVPEQGGFKTTPDGYPLTPYWDYPKDEQNDWSYENKLVDHVLVKLWKQGTRDFIGGSIELDTSRVRPHYLNTLYVQWEEVEHPDGSMVKMITRALGAGDVNWRQKGPFDLPPPEVHLIDINSTEGKGIDPFTFLTSEEFP